jgi:hypothetical protein
VHWEQPNACAAAILNLLAAAEGPVAEG